jgi:arylsulfatase A-like enzyme
MNFKLLLPLALSPMLVHATEHAPKPNIILFLVDDMGWQDTSVPFWTQKTAFNARYQTSNMERLAAQGMKFTQAYACSVSSPSRVSLLTGMNAARHRVTNWTLMRDEKVDGKDSVLDYPSWNMNGIQTDASINNAVVGTPLPQLLRENGYFTIHSGKAHFGAIGTPSANPLSLGFDVNIAGHAAGGPATYQGVKNYGNDESGNAISVWSIPGLEKYHGKDINLSEALTLEAELAMDKALNTEKPFFLYMAHYAVHVPLEADNRFYKKYKNQGLEEPEARYASMIEGMDKSLGDIMDYLDKKGIADNTIILFMSDNGGLSAHARGGKPHLHNFPLNSGKGSAYEGGIREPMIVKWTDKVKKGSQTNAFVIIEDFYPTILDMAGVKKYKTKQIVDGKSFVSRLNQEGECVNDRKLYWNFPNNWGVKGPGIGATSTIRSGDWKMVYYYGTGKKELFNIKNDIGETINMATENPQLLKRLSKELGQYLRHVSAQRPIFKSTKKSVPWPDEV